MKKFGEAIRNLRLAQELGLRETAIKVGISPAYLSRIERDKEHPPKPEVIKTMARILAADPDVLFCLASTTDPEFVEYINATPGIMNLLRHLKDTNFTESEIATLHKIAENIKTSHDSVSFDG